MEYIFHEKQEGSLCAQHCLNALLQGSYYTAVDLAQIAAELDQEERNCMAEGGYDTPAYQTFLQQPSTNYDDSGYFSIQVLQKAIRIWGLEFILFNSANEVAQLARQNPLLQRAYVCNFKEHWFTIRKIGHQWFNLNSLLSVPELISETYLSIFLAQLLQEGYTILIVTGDLPMSEADLILSTTLVTQPSQPELLQTKAHNSNRMSSSEIKFTVSDMKKALIPSATDQQDDDYNDDLEKAVALSLSESKMSEKLSKEELDDTKKSTVCDVNTGEIRPSSPTAAQIRKNRELFLSRFEQQTSPASPKPDDSS